MPAPPAKGSKHLAQRGIVRTDRVLMVTASEAAGAGASLAVTAAARTGKYSVKARVSSARGESLGVCAVSAADTAAAVSERKRSVSAMARKSALRWTWNAALVTLASARFNSRV